MVINKKEKHLMMLPELLEKRGWKIREEWYVYADKIPVGTVLGEWRLSQGAFEKEFMIEMVAEQEGISTLASRDNVGAARIVSLDKQFYVYRKLNLWK